MVLRWCFLYTCYDDMKKYRTRQLEHSDLKEISMGGATGSNKQLLDGDDVAYSSLFSGNLGVLEIDNIIAPDTAMSTEHAADAIDYGDEDELAEDDLPDEEESSLQKKKDVASDTGCFGDDNFLIDLKRRDEIRNDEQFDNLFSDHSLEEFGDVKEFDADLDFDNREDLERKQLEELRMKEIEELEQERFQDKLLKFYYPTFKRDAILKMNSVFGPKPMKYEYYPAPSYFKPLVPLKCHLEVDTDQRRIFRSTISHSKPNQNKRTIIIDDEAFEDHFSKESSKTVLDENLLLATAEWDYNKITGNDENNDHKNMENDISRRMKRHRYDLEADDYDDDAIFEGQLSSRLQLDFNDPNLLFLDDKEKLNKTKSNMTMVPSNEKSLLGKYNISNDDNYDLLKENYHSKIRSTIGNLNIEHSMPAIRLQSPYYKVKLTKNQLRDFHRTSFKVRPGYMMQFSKLKTRKKKKDRGKEIKELFGKSSDLTLGDTGQTVLLEHSEEVPIVLSNFGMGSKLINYYRKKNEDDISRPKLPIGETNILGVQDKSPFWNFGFVEPGHIVPTLYNKLVRAPVFKHDIPQTDFLLIKSSGAGVSQRFFLKNISHLFIVGQLFPVVDVPGPHSRKVTTASKNRLKMIVFRVLKRNPENRLLVKDISAHFPEQNDMQNRQRLKEFMEYQRSGDDQGYWKLKEEIPDDKLISPEDLTLLEAMQVTQQRLEDLEFYSGEQVNEELALWNLTKNFINATQGKAMLQLHGDSEGKSYSFMKTSMKGGFKSFESNGHSYNVALQQKAYDEEITKTWYSQTKKLTENAIFEPNIPQIPPIQEAIKRSDELNGKFLRITRMVRDKNGILQRKHEIIKDSEIVRAYIKRREKLEEDIMPEDVKLTNDEEKNLKNKKLLEEQLAKLQKNQERRNARKANRENLSGKGIGKGKSTTRRCATCGAIGHIRTNKSCPMYNEANM